MRCYVHRFTLLSIAPHIAKLDREKRCQTSYRNVDVYQKFCRLNFFAICAVFIIVKNNTYFEGQNFDVKALSVFYQPVFRLVKSSIV